MPFRAFNLIGSPNIDLWLSTLDQRFELGQRIMGVDVAFGYGEFIYSSLASGTMAVGRVVQWNAAYAIVDNPNTAGQGRPVGITRSKFDATAGVAYGWVQRVGVVPVQSGTIAATGPLYFSAAGTATTTLTAGKQILSATVLQIPTFNFTRQVTTKAGSPRIVVADLSGMFPGMAVSGTGIPGGATILSLESGSNNAFTLSANATAMGSPTGTFTYTGFGQVQLDYPFCQGNIT